MTALRIAAPAGTIIPRKFPVTGYDRAAEYFDDYFEHSSRLAALLDPCEVDRAATILLNAYSSRAGVFACGNGGSASIANHLQCDHLKGVRTGTDLLPRVMSLSANTELLTAIANDIGYEEVFTYQLQSQARPGDVLIAISSSGRSANIVRALTWARDHHVRTIALTGFDGGSARTTAEAAIHIDCANYGLIEDLHQAVMHALAQFIRQSRMTSESIASRDF